MASVFLCQTVVDPYEEGMRSNEPGAPYLTMNKVSLVMNVLQSLPARV